MSTEQTLQPGTTLQGGKYRIDRFISSGGFGCTYDGYHVLLRKRIAIKEFFVKDYCDRDETTSAINVSSQSKQPLVDRLRDKFLEEASSLSQLHHRGIVAVHDVFTENNTAYYVMDYVDGDTLSGIVHKRGPLDEATALRYIRAAAEALEYVHNNKRLHLDIKPGNIMVDNKDNVVLIDFGVSKQYDEVAGANTSTLLGMTPGYAAPEQMSNDVSLFMAATDIYSLGATLYYLLSGQSPKSATALASGDSLPPLPASVSPATRHTVEQAMLINRNMRPQSIAQFLALLDAPVAAPTPPAAPKPKPKSEGPKTVIIDKPAAPDFGPAVHAEPKKSGKTSALIIVAVVIIAAVATFFLLSGQSDEPATQTSGETTTEVVESSGAKTVENFEMTDADGDKFTYSGEVDESGIPSGQGTGKYGSGTYTGQYANGMPNGQGRYEDSELIYEGEMKDFEYVRGKMTFKNTGRVFEGTFKDYQLYNGSMKDASGKIIDTIKDGQSQFKNAQ